MFSRFQIVNFISKFSFFIVIICSMNPFKILLIFGKFACTHCPISCFKKRKIILKNSDYFANFSIFLRSTRQKSHGNWKNDLFFETKYMKLIVSWINKTPQKLHCSFSFKWFVFSSFLFPFFTHLISDFIIEEWELFSFPFVSEVW